MRREIRVAVGVVALCGAFWALPLYRVVSYLNGVPGSMSWLSVNEANDVYYGRSLLFSYLMCVLCPAFLGVLYVRRPGIFIVAPCLLMIAMAVRVIALRPEEVIVFLPTMSPYQPAQVALLAGFIGVIFYKLSEESADFDPS